MSSNRKITRKRNRQIKRRLWIATYIISTIVIGIGGYYSYTRIFPTPLYISPISSIIPFGFASEEDKQLERLKKVLREEHILFDQIKTTDTSYIIFLKSGSEVTFSKQKDINTQLSSLQFILSRLTMEGKTFYQLDLSFDKPVIRE